MFPKCYPHVIQISPIRYFLQPPNLMKSRVLTQIWHDYCRKNSTSYHLDITQISSKYHPEIIQKSFKYHPEIIQKNSEIIQKSSRNHPKIIQSTSIITTPELGKKSSFHPDMARLLQVKINSTFSLD